MVEFYKFKSPSIIIGTDLIHLYKTEDIGTDMEKLFIHWNLAAALPQSPKPFNKLLKQIKN